ncbi:MAG: CBS domain-containing protein [Acidimicrobiia bacterium]|nr:CBS domain-containing protein [Acidimicrobiia bacterium]
MSADSYQNAEFTLRTISHATVEDERLDYVNPDDEVTVALSRMVANEYSQMPVYAGSRSKSARPVQPQGVVTWKSITRALLSNGNGRLPTCNDACDPLESFQQFFVDASIVDVIQVLFEHDFILTYDNDGSFFGMMTSADLVRWADEYAMGLVEVRRLELRLRDICQRVKKTECKSPEQMNFGDYEKILVKDTEAWACLAESGLWQGVSRQEFCSLFKKAKKARNMIFHFACEEDRQKYAEYRKALARLVNLLEFARPEPPMEPDG